MPIYVIMAFSSSQVPKFKGYDMTIKESFFSICKDAKPAQSWFVSLYMAEQWYGGPEEGGWWGTTTTRIASQEFTSEEIAEDAKNMAEALAKKLTEKAKHQHGEQCLAELDFCERHGIDDSNDVFGEVGGRTIYSIYVEETSGQHEYSTSPYYE